MTQPAKSQEPSMEEILASIRRIIADDDANKTSQRAPEPPKPVAPAPAPPVAAPPAPSAVAPEPSFAEVVSETPVAAEPAPAADADLELQSADILDLTELMAAPMPIQSDLIPSRLRSPLPRRNFARSTAVLTSGSMRPPSGRRRRRLSLKSDPASHGTMSVRGFFRVKPAPRLIPPSIRWRKPCWCRTPVRLKIWCVRCCGRC